jgi:uncharacterized protein YdbL (DUF1318 family)
MKRTAIIILLGIAANTAMAQTTTDTSTSGKVTVIKDSRLTVLAEKEAAFNEAAAKLAKTTSKGYRLIVLSTNDRNLALKVRSQLLQRYPDQKVYMGFQAPYVKLKFGNFVDKGDADRMRKEILKNKIVTGNIYLVPETIEVKPDKNKESEQ